MIPRIQQQRQHLRWLFDTLLSNYLNTGLASMRLHQELSKHMEGKNTPIFLFLLDTNVLHCSA